MKISVFKKLFAVLLAVSFTWGLISISTFAEPHNEGEISKSKTADKTELTLASPRTEITLSIPSTEYLNKADVVFVMDKSTSTRNAALQFNEAVLSFIEALTDRNIDLKVGIIKYRGSSSDAVKEVSEGLYSGLTPVNETTLNYFSEGIALKPSGHGTNTHGALRLADEWLTADREVPDENKYVVLLTDGKSYIWDEQLSPDGPWTPTSIYTQFYKHFALQAEGKPAINQNSNYDKTVDANGTNDYTVGKREKLVAFNHVQNTYDEDFAALFNSTNPELFTKTKYDTEAKYVTDNKISLDGTVTAHAAVNGAELFPGKPAYGKYYEFVPDDPTAVWLEANPYEAVYDEASGTWSFDETRDNEDFYMYHVSNLEKGVYKASHLWADMTEKYRCGAIVYDKWGLGSGLGISLGFCNWLQTVGDYSADINEAESVISLFDSIQDDVLYALAKGTVEDTIGERFDLVSDAYGENLPFKLLQGTSLLPSVYDGENLWSFGSPEEGVYPYTVEYDSETALIRWKINVPVAKETPVQLKYLLEADFEGLTESGRYNANVKAEILYTDSSGNTFGPEAFEVPVINLIVEEETEIPIPSDDPPFPEEPDEEPLPDGDNEGPPTETDTPETGDNISVLPYALAATFAIILLTGILFFKKKRI